MPLHLRERLACALESGLLLGAPSTAAIRSVVGNSGETELIARALKEFDRLGASGPAAASWLRSMNKLHASQPQTDMVWSGPKVPGVHARDTRRVYEELLGSANASLWVSSYAFFDGPKAFEVLARRMESAPGIQVTLLLNIQRKKGDTTAADHLVRGFAERFWSVEWPGSARPRVFYDPRALEPEAPGGVLHAKAVVADGEAVFVTSANLTEAGWDRNIELGLLLRDCALAGSIIAHFRGLIERGLLRALPGE